MALRQDQKKTQKQKVSQSPQLIKAIALLEESNLEIQDSLYLERLTDAVLEEAEPKFDEDEDCRTSENVDWDIYFPIDDTGRIEREIRRKALPPLESVSSELTYDLQAHLISQLRLSKMNLVQKEIGAYLIGNLNENGYLDTSIEELWQKEQKYQLETWHETLELIQKFDPKGVAARDLQECLLIQARSGKRKNSLAEKIIKNHWNNLLSMKCDAIARFLSVPLYDVHAAISIISGFNPRPGQLYNKNVYFNNEISTYSDSAFHIQPDFYIYSNGDEYSIEPEFEFIPAILTQYYLEKINNIDSLTAIEKKYLLKKLDKVKGIINQHYQRNKNIVNAIKSIVSLQKDFFDFGSITNLEPLIARDVANEINLDESTVRRIRKNKYIDTPHGIFELNFFFDQVGYDTHDGMKMASKGVKELISNIIKSENKKKPYSDQRIADILQTKYDIKIKVRTTGKYRESIGILPARLRKWPC